MPAIYASRRTPCRSERAREEPKGTASIQNARVIVGDHRERARSYSISDRIAGIKKAPRGVLSLSLEA